MLHSSLDMMPQTFLLRTLGETSLVPFYKVPPHLEHWASKQKPSGRLCYCRQGWQEGRQGKLCLQGLSRE